MVKMTLETAIVICLSIKLGLSPVIHCHSTSQTVFFSFRFPEYMANGEEGAYAIFYYFFFLCAKS